MKTALLLALVPAMSHAEQATYHRYFNDTALGTYAAQGDCAAPELYASFTATHAEISETRCAVADIITPEPGVSRIQLTECRAEGTPTEDITLDLAQLADGSFRLNWFGDLPLFHCPER